MKKIDTSLLIAFILTLIGALLIGGATIALFTDTAQNTSNNFAAGTLSINLTREFGEEQSFTFGNIAPGDSGSDTIIVRNNGSLELRYRLNNLSKDGYLLTGGDYPIVFSFTVNGEPLVPGETVRVLPSGATETITVNWWLPLDAGNDYQGTSGTLGISVSAEQTANNPVPFGN